METIYIVLGIAVVVLVVYYFIQKGKKEVSPEESTQIPSQDSETPPSQGPEA